MEELVVIDTHYAYFALLVEDGVVILAPPIARWTIGKRIEFVTHWYRSKRRARITVVSRNSEGKGVTR